MGRGGPSEPGSPVQAIEKLGVGVQTTGSRWTDFFFKDFIYLFLEKEEGREKERERRETSIGCLSYAQTGH